MRMAGGKSKTRMLFGSFTFMEHEGLLFKQKNICTILEDNGFNHFYYSIIEIKA